MNMVSKITLSSVRCLSSIPIEKKHVLYLVWSDDFTRRTFIGSSSLLTLEAYLPSLDPLNILVEIRDHFDCVTAVNLTDISVRDDVDGATNISDAFTQLLQHGNAHEMGQALQVLSHRVNKKSPQTCMTSIMFPRLFDHA